MRAFKSNYSLEIHNWRRSYLFAERVRWNRLRWLADTYVYALGAWSGNLVWKFKTLGTIESSPAVANGRVFTGGDDGYVYCLDAYRGTLLWKAFVNGNVEITYGSAVLLRSSPTLAGNTVYVGSLDGYVYALDATSGRIIWRFKTEGAVMCFQL